MYGMVYGLQVSRLKCITSTRKYQPHFGSHWKGVPSNILHMSHGMYSFLMSFEHEPEFSNQR